MRKNFILLEYKMNLCCIITCLGVVVALALAIWVLIKQHDCCNSKQPFAYSQHKPGAASCGGLWACVGGKCKNSSHGHYGSMAECDKNCAAYARGPCAKPCCV